MLRLVAAVLSVFVIAEAAKAQVKLAGLTYRSGPYAVAGIPFSDGYADYLTLLNERDGGINGELIELIECEFGYNTERGVACYDETITQGVLSYQPLSTGLTYSLVERAAKDGVVLHTMGYGITAASEGEKFRYVFNFPAHYWDAASAQIRYLKEANEGSLAGKKIVHLHHNSGYGKEPIPTLERLAEVEGFELILVPIDHPGEDQSTIWPEIEKMAPDHILLWGWGVMNEVALRGAKSIGFPIEDVFGIWWSANEADVKPLGRSGDGYKAVTFHAVGTNFRIYNELNELVYFQDKARGELNNLGEVLYNRGIAAAFYATEAIRLAMEIHGTSKVTREMVRDGFEQLSIGDEDFVKLGMEGFTPPMNISCADHGGSGLVAVKEWNAIARQWVQITDYYEPNNALIEPQVKAAAEAFVADKNLGGKPCP